MPDPEVSIVIQVSEPLAVSLGDAIGSALEQSVGTCEVVAITTPALFEGEVKAGILQHGSAVRHYIGDPNLSAGSLLRIGTAAARGRFIAWLSPDDTYDARKIEKQIDALGPSGIGCVTCGSRLPGQIEPVLAAESDAGMVAVLKSLLNGSRDPTTLLVSRDLLEAVGGVEPAFAGLVELDLAVRLALRYPIAHVPATLVRRNFQRPPRPDRGLEYRRIVNRIFEGSNGITCNLQALGQVASVLGENTGAVFPAIRDHVAALVKEPDLAITTLCADGGLAPAKVAEMLGVPEARATACTIIGNNLGALAEALCISTAEWLMVVDTAAPPERDAFAIQLLHSAAEGLDACLAVRDPLIYASAPMSSLIAGTLFKRSALKKVGMSAMKTEAQFWAAFGGIGNIGALPATSFVTRPVRSAMARRLTRNGSAMQPANLVIALIDGDWYRVMNPDVAALNVNPANHFLDIGWRERRCPNPWFHTAWYLAQNPEVLEGNINPLEHFVRKGARAGLQPSPGFDIAWYSKQYLDMDEPCADALLHFMTMGLSMGAVPYPRIQKAQAQRLVKIGEFTGPVVNDESLLAGLVDADWYRTTYMPGQSSLFDALAHYRGQGWRQDYDPNAWFDTRWYLTQNAEARGEDSDPLTHFVRSGARSGRKPHPFFDMEWYAQYYLAGVEPSAEVLRHFLTIGLAAGAVPHPRLATAFIKKRLLQIPVKDRSTLLKRLQNLLAQIGADGEIVSPLDVDLWPLVLAEDFPPDISSVLLICERAKEGLQFAEVAGSVLPMGEYPLFGVVESDHTLRIANRVAPNGVSLKFRAPEQELMLKDLLTALHCQRAAVVGEHLLGHPIVRTIRNVCLPVFSNGRSRAMGNTAHADTKWMRHCVD